MKSTTSISALAAPSQVLLDVVHRQVLVRGEHDVRNRFTLLSDRESLLAQETPKKSNE